MANGNFISYIRVSTDRQGRSGLGLAAQRKAIETYLNGGRWQLVQEFKEVESGRKSDRPELAKAIKACRAHQATLVIARLDRLARDAHFLLGLQKAGVKFVACDMPEANEMTIGIMAIVAESEAKRISHNTKEALKAAKDRGTKLGGIRPGQYVPENARENSAKVRAENAQQRADDLTDIIGDIQGAGAVSFAAIARELTKRAVPTPRGNSTNWTATQVARIFERLK